MDDANHDASDVLEQFRQQGTFFSKIYDMHSNGTLGTFIEGIDNIERLFELDDRRIRCNGERTPGGLHAAGSLILLEEHEAIRMIKVARADGLYSHSGCTAAGIAFEKLSGASRRFYCNPDNYAMLCAKALCKKAGIPYSGHIQPKPAFNNARMAVYDGTGRFDNSEPKMKIAGLPPCTVISRRYHQSCETAKNEVRMAIGTATSERGYGRLINERKPFLLLVAGTKNKDFSLHRLMDEAMDAAKQFGNKVIVDGFVAPV